MNDKIVVGTNTMLVMARNMLDRGEISLSQYGTMCRRIQETIESDEVKKYQNNINKILLSHLNL